jgi:UDP-3-O-[3-hydroxymyristoyl] glucosamine N-acyltransferase
VSGHLTIGAGAKVGAQGGVISDIPPGETWSGYPARPHRESLRAHAALFKLAGLMKRLEKLLDKGDA